MSKYAETHALALAIHAASPLATTPEAQRLFAEVLVQVGKLVDQSPTMYTATRFAEVAVYGAPQGPKMTEEKKAQLKAARAAKREQKAPKAKATGKDLLTQLLAMAGR